MKVSLVVAFLMCSGSEFQTEEPKRESMITFCFALIKWNFEEAGVGTGAKRSRRRVHKQKVREISRGGGGDGVEPEACSLAPSEDV